MAPSDIRHKWVTFFADKMISRLFYFIFVLIGGVIYL